MVIKKSVDDDADDDYKCPLEWNHLSNFGRGSLKEHIYENIGLEGDVL